MTLRSRPFVDAAVTLGAKRRWFLFREVLPNVLPVVVVYWAVQLPASIVAEATTARARASCTLNVFSSRAARLREYCQVARHAFGWSLSFQTGSARRRRLSTTERPRRGCDGVDGLPGGENIAGPMEVGEARSPPGAFVAREQRMNFSPASSNAVRLDADSITPSAGGRPSRPRRGRGASYGHTKIAGTQMVPCAHLAPHRPKCSCACACWSFDCVQLKPELHCLASRFDVHSWRHGTLDALRPRREGYVI